MLFINAAKVQELIDTSPEGKNTKFLSAAHSLWTRFHNYEKQLPMALEVDGKIVSLIFATFNRDTYSNLYEIVTIQGHEGKGYASEIWSQFTEYAVNQRGITRLKLSCTPSSVTWHMRNGLLFWAVDPTGSLRSDQKLFATREEQLVHQQYAVLNPHMAQPPTKPREQFLKEDISSYKFGKKKIDTINTAIKSVGTFWMRDSLFNVVNLEDFCT